MTGDWTVGEWARQLSCTLVGREVPLALTAPEVPQALDRLADAGFDASAVSAHAGAVRAEGGVWPHPVPVTWLRRVGAARWSAAVADAVHRLGLDADRAVRSAAPRPLDPDERRLLADKPPHHGS